MDLFDQIKDRFLDSSAPLAARMRPKFLDDYVGQEHILGPGRLLRRAIEADQLSSLIFYGPPGTGKTTLAKIIANTTKSNFISLNAVLSGVKDIRNSIEIASDKLKYATQKTILFVDEVHRFNKSQQDALLPHVENGTIILIGATTENPYFEVNKALVSRSRIFELRSLENKDLYDVLENALNDKESGFGDYSINMHQEAKDHLVNIANGDARSLLNALELAVVTSESSEAGCLQITREVAEESIQKKAVLYDKDGDSHFDTISAFIKSIRGSDPDASLYWLARMVYAGEDPRFIFRRLIILASEDIGLANPQALSVVMSAAQAYDYVGMPEGQFHLSHATLFLATCDKSNTTLSYFDALESVKSESVGIVPNHLKDTARDSEDFGHGKGYKYPHAFKDHWVEQQYLPDSLKGKEFYHPSNMGYEKGISEKINLFRELQFSAMLDLEDNLFINIEGIKHEELWIQRSVSNKTDNIEKINTLLFEFAKLQSDQLVLDLKFGSGLITWEAQRKSKKAGVYSLMHKKDECERFENKASSLEFHDRPIAIDAKDKSFSRIVEDDLKDIMFDLVIGKSVFSRFYNDPLFFKNISKILKGGTLVFCEQIPSFSFSPSHILRDVKHFQDLFFKVKNAEKDFYLNASQGKYAWTEKDIVEKIKSEKGFKVQVEKVEIEESYYINSDRIQTWFENTNVDSFSYFEYLEKYLSLEEISTFKKEIESRSLNKWIDYKLPVYFFVAKAYG